MALVTRVSDKERLDNGNLRLKVTVNGRTGGVFARAGLLEEDVIVRRRAKARAVSEAGVLSEEIGRPEERAEIIDVATSGEIGAGFFEEIVYTMEVES